MSDYLDVSYLPDPGVEPRATYGPNSGDPIPAIYLSRQYSGGAQLKIQFSSKEPADAIRYLRQLAAVATDLADQVQDHVAEAVLSS